MTLEEQNKKFVLDYIDAYNAQDWPRLEAMLHPDIILKDENRKLETHGVADAMALYMETPVKVAQRGYRNTGWFLCEGNRVMIEHEFHGYVKVDSPLVGKAGEEITLKLITKLEIKDGKLLRHDDYG